MFADFMIDFMKESVNEDIPFFAYYPMVLMHTPWERTPDHPDITDINSPEAKKANVEYTDKIVGRLMDALDELGVRENTLVVFIGDNGTQEIGKSTVTEWGARVPCIISCPGVVQSDVVSMELVELSDILPTMLDFAGITVKNADELDGFSALPLLIGETDSHREYIWSNYGQFRIIREKHWLLERNSIDDFGDLYYCGDIRNGLGYQRITDFSNPEALQAKERFTRHIERMPVVEIREDDRIDFADFVDRKKRSLVRSLKDIYDEDYGADQY
jgi:arylsulfatase A